MLEIKKRDVKVKCRKFRNEGLATGTLKRKDGEIIPIYLLSRVIDKILVANNYNKNIVLTYDGEEIQAKIDRLQRHLTLHNTINADFIEQ